MPVRHRESSFDFSFAEFTAWTREAGFVDAECLPLVGTASAAVAYKAHQQPETM
jgi:hypothetical protein